MTLGNYEKEKIFIAKEAYERMILYGSRYANQDMHEKAYREVYGILIGFLDENDNTHIRTAIPITAGSGAGVNYESKHYSETAKIDEQIYEQAIHSAGKDYQEMGKEFLVGWWHTHPGFGFFYSQTDTMTHLGWQQANPFAIGIIYDFTEANSVNSGIEVLRLEDVSKNIMSPYIFVDFELEGDLETINETEKSRKTILPKIIDLQNDIKKLDKEIRKKKFAQLQRNYGLLMVKKTKSEISDEDQLDEEEKYLYEWNEEWIKKKFRVPKYRQKIEKMIKEGERQKSPKKRENYRKKIEKHLSKPKEIVLEIKDAFYEIKQRADIYKLYIDTDEITALNNLERKISDYIDIMNDLITKAYYLFPDQ